MKNLSKIAITLSMLLPSSALLATGMIWEAPIGDTQLYASKNIQTSNAPAWDSETVYLKDDTVSYQQKVYSAKWWSENELPTKTWTAWQPITRDYHDWSKTQQYQLDEHVLFNGELFQAVYVNQGQSPTESGAWIADKRADNLAELTINIETVCSNYIEHGRYGPSFTSSHCNYTLILPEQLSSSLSFTHWNQYSNDELISSEEISTRIDGQSCSGFEQCSGLFNGNEAMIGSSRFTLYSNYRKNYYIPTENGTETYTERNKPLTGSIELCNENNICRTYNYKD